MKLNQMFRLLLVFLSIGVSAQNQLKVYPFINLPKDSLESQNLISDLNNFLEFAQKPNEDNKLVFPEKKIETFLLLNEMKNIQKSEKFKDDYFFKPYLNNISKISENQYLIQLSYIGVNNNEPILKANFCFIAVKNDNSFLFFSPLSKLTENWKILKIDNLTFHYKNIINKDKIDYYKNLVSPLDKRLKLTNNVTDFYCCENLIEAEKIIGVDYKSDYNGKTNLIRDEYVNNKEVVVLGNNNSEFTHFDEHDLWHNRLGLVIDRSKVNKSVDEGCAYIYGGSWGLSWREIFREFKTQIASNKNIDWKKIKENPINFKTNNYNNNADYIVNALLVKKIENEKGFSGVWQLLNTGPYEKGNEEYYHVLKKLIGINKSNYNKEIWKLIEAEK